MTARLKNYLPFTPESCQIFASPSLNAVYICKSPSGLQGVALGPDIQMRTRSALRMAGVSQVSFILSQGNSFTLNTIENLGL